MLAGHIAFSPTVSEISIFLKNFTKIENCSKSRHLLHGFLDGFVFLVEKYILCASFVKIFEHTFLQIAIKVGPSQGALSLLHTLSPPPPPLSLTGARCISLQVLPLPLPAEKIRW